MNPRHFSSLSMRFFVVALTLALTAILSQSGHAQVPAMKPGVTAWVYETGEPMDRLGILVAGQTPNYSDDHLEIDFSGSWETSYGTLSQYYIGLIWGQINASVAGTYQFRVTSDDGARFFISDQLVVSNDTVGQEGERSATASIALGAGKHPFKLRFYQNSGSSRLRLEWQPPGATSFSVVPSSALEAEDGLTHVTSPGLKRYYYENGGGQAGGPGDGRPIEGVHPSYTLGNFRPFTFRPQVGGMDFLPDGRLVICTWDPIGAVYILGNINGPRESVTVTRFAEGLGEPLGVKVVDGEIYVAQKGEVTHLRDTDGDGIADEYESVASGWPASHNYHEFTFGLLYKEGHFYITTSVPLKTGDSMYMPTTLPAGEESYPVPNGPGSLIRIDPSNGSWEIIARGLRTPNGLGLGIDGEIFCGENQGGWVPSSKLNILKAGGFYGHQPKTDGNVATNAPALWLPHGEISNSPAEPTVIPSGPYAGQMLFAELTHGGLNRVFLEKINGQYQGAVFQFSQGLESGLNRLAWAPDGTLYVGGLGSGGNWNWEGTLFGLQKLSFNGTSTFEMKSIRSRSNGFIVELTNQVPYAILANPANYQIQQWYYAASASYGGSKQGVTTLTPSQVSVSQDRRKVFLEIPGLQSNRVVYFRLRNFQSDSEAPIAPWSTEAWYTLNEIGPVAGPDFVPVPPIPLTTVTFGQEAEDAARSANVTVESNHTGFSGTGFANLPASGAANLTFTITTDAAGVHDIGFRYALGAADRSVSLSINGGSTETLSFPNSGAWNTWQTRTISRTLLAGANSIRISSSNDGPNLDLLTVARSGAMTDARTLFDRWAQNNGLTDVEPDSDADTDGFTNLIEYGTGGDPRITSRSAPGGSLVPQVNRIGSSAGDYIQVTYRRRIDYTIRGLTYVVETASDLAQGVWTPLVGTQVGEAAPTGDGVTEFVTVRSSNRIDPGQTSLFVRVKQQLAN